MISFMLRLFYPQIKRPLVPILYEAGWVPEPMWIQWQREKSLCPLRIKCQLFIPQPVALVTENYPICVHMFLLFATMSRPAVVSTQSPNQQAPAVLPLSSTEGMTTWSFTCITPYVLMVWCLSTGITLCVCVCLGIQKHGMYPKV